MFGDPGLCKTAFYLGLCRQTLRESKLSKADIVCLYQSYATAFGLLEFPQAQFVDFKFCMFLVALNWGKAA